MRYEVREMGPWRREQTLYPRSASKFRVTWSQVLDHLTHELELIDVKLCVVELDIEAERNDGRLRGTLSPKFGGVRISVDSMWGPLQYQTDVYARSYSSDLPSWQANLRAISLSLEALRAVDRHGISGSGEQYVGWKQLGAAPHVHDQRTIDALLLADLQKKYTVEEILADRANAERAWKVAADAGAHPDRGGDVDSWVLICSAKDRLMKGDY